MKSQHLEGGVIKDPLLNENFIVILVSSWLCLLKKLYIFFYFFPKAEVNKKQYQKTKIFEKFSC